MLGAWLNSQLAGRQHGREQEDKYRDDALKGLAGFMSLVLDAQPDLILAGDLREYASPKDAIAGLYERWKQAREPMVLLAFSHPSGEVRNLAFKLQAELELVLRHTDDHLLNAGGSVSVDKRGQASDEYQQCLHKGKELGRLLLGSPAASSGLPFNFSTPFINRMEGWKRF